MKVINITAGIAISLIVGAMIGITISQFNISTGAFYNELRKRALTSSDFICSEAREAKFLYDTYKIRE